MNINSAKQNSIAHYPSRNLKNNKLENLISKWEKKTLLSNKLQTDRLTLASKYSHGVMRKVKLAIKVGWTISV